MRKRPARNRCPAGHTGLAGGGDLVFNRDMPASGQTSRRALLTGASSGIGRALAIELARAGDRLLLVSRRAKRLEALSAEHGTSGQIDWIAGDVTDPEFRTRALARCRDRMGGLDLLINNAGVGASGPFESADEARLRRIMEVNFFAAAQWTREALELLRKGHRPMIVNVSSVLGHRAVPHCSEYCASKFALQGLSEALRVELAGTGIGLLVVSPGTTDTEFFDNVLEDTGARRWSRRPAVSAEHVARQTLRAIARRKHEIIPSFPGRLLCLANRLSPRLTDWLVARFA